MRERNGREIKGGRASCWNLQVMARALGREVTGPDLFKRVTLAVVWKIDYRSKRWNRETSWETLAIILVRFWIDQI